MLVAPAASSAEKKIECAPVVMLTARGSGEPLTDTHGPTLRRMVDAIQETKLKDGFDGGTILDYPIPYLAVGMEQYVTKDETPDLFDSVDYGVIFGQSLADVIEESCPGTKFLLLGYSQGVLVARRLAEDLGKERVAGVIGVGDPAQKGDMPSISGGGRHGDGLFRWLISDEDDGASTDSFYDAGIRYSMWCHAQDWICNFYDEKNRPEDASNPMFQTYDHAYATKPDEALAIGAVGAVMARDAIEHGGEDPDEGSLEEGSGSADTADVSQIDVVFVIDTTGSMEPYIEEARDTAGRIAERLHEDAKIVRTAVVEYRDKGDDFRARFALGLTPDQDEFEAALEDLVADGGGDDPESVLSGVMMALRARWAPDAIRAVVVLGDAPAKDPEPGTRYTTASVTAAMKDLDRVPDLPPNLGRADSGVTSLSTRSAPTVQSPAASADVALFALTSSEELEAGLTPVAEATGGRVTAVSDDAEDVSSALLETMALIATKPVAALAPPALAYAGLPFVLNAGGSRVVPGSTFEFDVDSDGTFESRGLTSAQPQTVAEPGSYSATVRVTDPQGRSATATTDYEVAPREDLRGMPRAEAGRSDGPDVGQWATWAAVTLAVLLACFAGGFVTARRRGGAGG